jgi:DNA (cytosine-5)-methyltransferase 1
MVRKPLVYNLKEAAALLGVAPITLKRWLLSKKVGEVARDRNGWRVFTESDIERIRRFAMHLDPPEK